MEQKPADVTAGAVRAELARARTSARKMATDLGWSKTSLSRRLNGEYPFTITQLCAIANYLEVPLNVLLPTDERAA